MFPHAESSTQKKCAKPFIYKQAENGFKNKVSSYSISVWEPDRVEKLMGINIVRARAIAQFICIGTVPTSTASAPFEAT